MFEFPLIQKPGSSGGTGRLAHLKTYCAGWASANAGRIRSALANDYVWDDPEEGRVTNDELTIFLAGLRSRIDRLREDQGNQPYLVILNPILDEGPIVTMGWWHFMVPGTSIEGVSCVHVRDDGVICEHRANCGRDHYRVVLS